MSKEVENNFRNENNAPKKVKIIARDVKLIL